ncbi:acetylserotonin O-methyltransferase-like isoform X5 [Pseudophryne corroboree]|uniref:acetylserotonin O-methyltransferase-like isoform X5 n=1 Tax=Pseudophryne corroboree TaxID=495146 RepID=UPI0030812C6F
MSSTEDPDYPQQLLNYRDGFIVSKAMFTACELGVFDLLHELGEPLTTATIASRLCTSVDGTDRLLTACVGLKLLKVELKNDEAYYSNTDLSTTYLVKSSPKTMYPMMMYCTNTAYICWQFLPEAIREGKCQYERAFGVSSEDLFNAIYRSEEMLVTFMGFMDSISNNFGKYALQAFDLSTFHTVCDLGGDFFTDPIPEADLFILSSIIHDWTEEKCHHLLKKVYQSCRPDEVKVHYKARKSFADLKGPQPSRWPFHQEGRPAGASSSTRDHIGAPRAPKEGPPWTRTTRGTGSGKTEDTALQKVRRNSRRRSHLRIKNSSTSTLNRLRNFAGV